MQKFCKYPFIFLTANALITYSIQGLTEEWSSIIKKDGYEIFVDIDSYNQENGWPYMNTNTVYKKPQALNKTSPSKTYMSHVLQLQFNCKNPVYRSLSSTFYDSQHQAIGRVTPMKNFQAIPANSDIFSIGQLTCQVHQMVGGQ
jgi:hypothetical protein